MLQHGIVRTLNQNSLPSVNWQEYVCSVCGKHFEASLSSKHRPICPLHRVTVYEPKSTRAYMVTVLGEPLTNRERQVVRLLAEGKRNRDIGRELLLTEGTIKVYVARIFIKLGLKSRTEAVRWWYTEGCGADSDRPGADQPAN